MSNEEGPPKGVAIFRPDAVYSRAAMDAMLSGIVESDRFLERLRVPRRFKNCVLGADILRAFENPPEEAILGEPPISGTFDVDAILGKSAKGKGAKRGPTPRCHGLRQLTKEDVLPKER